MSAVQQHTDPTSYSWSLIRYSVVKLVLHNLNTFLPHVGIDLPGETELHVLIITRRKKPFLNTVSKSFFLGSFKMTKIKCMTFSELPVCSPLMHAVLKTLEQWRDILQGKLELFSGPPEDFIANLHIDVIPGKPHSKFKALMSPSNSPFM